jgi:hypothetical protein
MIKYALALTLNSLILIKCCYSQLPEGNNGIANQYPGDRDINNDSRVVLSENFEIASIDVLKTRWDMVRDSEVMSLSTKVPELSQGQKSLLITQIAEKGTGADLYTRLPKGLNKVHARFYVRFAKDCEPIHHFGTCLGGNRPAKPWPQVRAGEPTQGDKAFWVGIEPFGKSWRWDYYAYWHEMRGSPPRGQTWGNSFINDDAIVVKKEQWICLEMMIKMNDVGESNGELALWLDGKLISHLQKGYPKGVFVFDKFFPNKSGEGVIWDHKTGDRRYLPEVPGGSPFPGFNWRTTEELDVNFVWLYVYLTQGSEGHANEIWFDDVVVATDYIGPMR